MRILWVLLLLLAGSAKAELALDLYGLSHHLENHREYNEINYGAGIAYGGENIKTVAGFMQNSMNDRIFYFGEEFSTGGAFRLGVMAGVVSGYKYPPVCQSERPPSPATCVNGVLVFPSIIPFLQVGSSASLRVGLIPKSRLSPAVIIASIRIE